MGILIKVYKRETLEKLVNKVLLSEDEAEEIKRIVEEGRTLWWRSSYY